jgi:hypothetical protein
MYFLIGGDGKEYGPKAAVEVREWIAEGRLNAQSQIKPQSETEWVQLGSLLEFAADLNPQSAEPLPTPVSPSPQNPTSFQASPNSPAPPSTYPTIHSKPRPTNNRWAVVSLILGIISFVTVGCCGCFALDHSDEDAASAFFGLMMSLIVPTGGLSCALVARAQLKKPDNTHIGEGMAMAGLICSSLCLVAFLILSGLVLVKNLGT